MAHDENTTKDELDETAEVDIHKGDTDPEAETIEPEALDDDADETERETGPQAPEGAGRTGDRVGYTSTHKGCLKMATVAFDDRTFQRGTSAPQLTTGSARHLLVTGMHRQYMKHDVPYGRPGQPGTWHELPE
jgi:hypothetical protein